MLLLMLVVVLTLGLFVYKKFFFAKYIQKALREEVMLEVQSQLADYVQLDEAQQGHAAPGGPLTRDF